MQQFTIWPIGRIQVTEEGTFIQLSPPYAPALEGLEGFSHLQILWWFDGCDQPESREKLTVKQPYTQGPAVLGTFATRSPERPNAIALSTAQVLAVDPAAGRVQLAYIDAQNDSPLLDIKPYTPSLDRAEHPSVPAWCAHWPQSLEESADFDWAAEFNF